MPLQAIVGARLAGEVTFRVAGVPTDPDVVTVRVRDPSGSLTVTVYPTTDLTREDTGMYRMEFNTTVPGSYGVRFEGTGTVEAAAEQSIIVNPSAVL